MRASDLAFLVAAGCGSGTPSRGLADSGTDQLPVYAGEILRNGNFESLDASGWISDWTNMDANPGGLIAIVDDPVRFGAHAVQWQIDAAGGGYEYWFYQANISAGLIVAGQTYELTGWFRTDHVSPDLAFNYSVRGEPGDTPDISTLSAPAVGPTEADVWQHFAYAITIPSGVPPASWTVGLHSIKFNADAEKLSVDAVSLHPKL